jgi:hypothetical protein
MLDIISGSFGIYGGAPSAQWRGEDLVSQVMYLSLVTLGNSVQNGGVSLNASVLSVVGSLSLVRNGVGRVASVGNLFFHR